MTSYDTAILVNDVTANLAPYPMEELARIKQGLRSRSQEIFDFGTGDPQIPTWTKISDALKQNTPSVSQYPQISGKESLRQAHFGYLNRRLGLVESEKWNLAPTRGSKEAIFHIALSLVGRGGGRKKMIYPTPGYPVYRSSIAFAGGIPVPITLEEEQGYLLEPWKHPPSVVRDAAAIWVNYPHNPTGACAPKQYWENLIDWCHETDTILLSDDCYLDIYPANLDKTQGVDHLPICPLTISVDRVLSFLSLSKRSGMTGYRTGMICGDSRIINPHIRARANFGLGQPNFIQSAAIQAWKDDHHVATRRKIFQERMDIASPKLISMNLLDRHPEATFYLWCQTPAVFANDDIKFSLGLAKHGVITTPSSWISEGVSGKFRLALVPEIAKISEAMMIIEDYIQGKC